MKYNKLKYLFIALLSTFVMSCEDNDPLSAGNGDPLTKDIVTVDATVASLTNVVAEGRIMNFTVDLSQSFNSDATVTVKMLLDNGNFSSGTAKVTAGSTSGSGSLVVPADDGFTPAELSLPNAASIQATAILLDELIPNTTHVIASNIADLGVYARTLAAAGGLNYILDWSTSDDIDLQVIDEAFTSIFESSGSSSRFESDLFQSAGRPDGVYIFYARIFDVGDTLPNDVNFNLLLTRIDNSLQVLQGVLPAGTEAGGARIPIASFEKSTDATSGEISYINVMLL